MEHFRLSFHGKEVVVRDIREDDISALVSYWHDSPLEYLQSLGVSLSKLGSREAMEERFRSSLPSAPSTNGPRRITLVITASDEILFYTNLNIRTPDEAYAHFHVLQQRTFARAVAYLVFPRVMQLYFDLGAVRKIVMQTAVENQNISRYLHRFGLVSQRIHLATPDGMARPGDFNVYEILPNDCARLQPTKRKLA